MRKLRVPVFVSHGRNSNVQLPLPRRLPDESGGGITVCRGIAGFGQDFVQKRGLNGCLIYGLEQMIGLCWNLYSHEYRVFRLIELSGRPIRALLYLGIE